jgi:hypothetical protein
MLKKISVNFPPQFSMIVLKKKNKTSQLFYCYNKIYFYKFSFEKFIFDVNLNSITAIIDNNNELDIFEKNVFKKFIKSLDCYFFLKIKFKGKGYKIKYSKKRKFMRFFFGRSHITFMKYKNVIIKKTLKYKFVLKSNNLEKLKFVGNKTKNIKNVNIFTSRGIRISRSVLFKRRGKKNTTV